MEHQISTKRQTYLTYVFRHYPIPANTELCENNKVKGCYGRNILRDVKDILGFTLFSWIFYLFFARTSPHMPSVIVFFAVGIFMAVALFFLYLMLQRIMLFLKYGDTFLHLKVSPIYFRDSINGNVEFTRQDFTDLTLCLRYITKNGVIVYEDRIILKNVHNRQHFSFELPKEEFDSAIYEYPGNWQIEACGDRSFANFRTTYFLPIKFKESQEAVTTYYEDKVQHQVHLQSRRISRTELRNKGLVMFNDNSFISTIAAFIFAFAFFWLISVNAVQIKVLQSFNAMFVIAIAGLMYINSLRSSVFGSSGNKYPWSEQGVSAMRIPLRRCAFYELIMICVCCFTLLIPVGNKLMLYLSVGSVICILGTSILYKWRKNAAKKATSLRFENTPFYCGEKIHANWQCQNLFNVLEVVFYVQCIEEILYEDLDEADTTRVDIYEVYTDVFMVETIPKHKDHIAISFVLPQDLGTQISSNRAQYWQLKAKVKGSLSFEAIYLLPIFVKQKSETAVE